MNFKMKRFLSCIFLSACVASSVFSQPDSRFTITRLKYSGGGDWYSNASSLPNLLKELNKRLSIDTTKDESVVVPSDPNIFSHPFLYMNGHGVVRFSEVDVRNLRKYFERGGFLWADDNFGMDESFRKEIVKVFPNEPLVEIPHDHPVFSIYYKFEDGLPKIHEHYGGAPRLYGIFLGDRLAVLYTFNTDIGDGLESEGIHKLDSPEVRELAMRMAVNIVLFVLSS